MKNRGFTLIETIVYVALFGVLMAGILPAVYSVLQGGAQINRRATVQDEENFVFRKIGWALSSIDPAQTYSPASGSSAALSLTRYDGIHVAMRLSGTTVQLSEDGGVTYYPITTPNVQVSDLTFTYLSPSGNGPAGMRASMTINGESASTTRYIRK
ncbi:MAG: hypothetical protein UY70_C0021G0010 [Candidatus Kaiserbacteria bacterium GW2011_GWB1_52_6]|uniref:Type II secretion system protein n=3 Tax=Candidatus Kaiseribacteriota TaxID=1752734 RepID=A0A0G1XLW5_9BACT|nr:MAG: hypothetical protein UY67_C0015G0010 [Candidatus Kaiserbacteria bacterium GW2011_GWA2_52_12]KKW26610.1 MAG: hypothetical protein UY70_C0021G0010 [Candidatus Kaiserbacteria bacterium GW2011_GWB1_52_6]KKW31891.1 MAG: hypothetical protein UY74_C0004G0011 [Candidatus Kaiserbacteria bacterium GW2011_GWC2_52_8b]